MSRAGPVAALGVLAALVACTSSVPAEPGQGAPATAAPATAAPSAVAPAEGRAEPGYPWGPSRAEVAAATATAAAMSAEEVAGQVIVGRLPGPDPAAAAALVTDLHLAGVMIAGTAVASQDQVLALTTRVHDAVAASGRDWPALVSTDNEGGSVQRLSGATGGWTTFPSFADAGRAAAAGQTRLVREAYAAMGRELRATGVTVNWAPVADVTVPGEDVAIGSRSAGEDPAAVTATVLPALRGLLDGGVLPAVKHFPGHGSLDADSHTTLPVQTGDAEHIAATELPPFGAAVAAGVPMVMLAHVDVPAWQPGVPASVSPAAYRVLREELGFAGVTVTDSLGMGALNTVGDDAEVAVAALAAGADLLLSPADNAAAHAGVVTALTEGTLDRDRVDEAAGRVIALLRHQDRLAERAGPVTPAELGSAAQAAQALRRAAR